MASKSNTPTINFKRGDSFRLPMKLRINSGAALTAKQELDKLKCTGDSSFLSIAQANYDLASTQDISLWTVNSQLRRNDTLIHEFTIESVELTTGQIALVADKTVTALWEPREHVVDVQFISDTGFVNSTQTFIINVQEDVTRYV